MRDVVIDLGELTQGADPPAPGSAARPAVRRPPRRRVWLAAVAVLLAATMTGSGPPPEPTPVTAVPVGAGDVTFLSDDKYFVISEVPGPAGSPVQNKIIDVYDLPSAAPSSRTSVAVTGRLLHVLSVGDLILVSYQSDGVGNIATAAYRAGTEQTVWRRYGRLFGLTPSRRAALVVDTAADSERPRWYGVDVRSGRVGWQFEQRADENTVLVPGVDSEPERLVGVSPDGRIEVRDLDTGRPTASATVPAFPGQGPSGVDVGVAGDLLLVGGGRPGTSAYGLSDLRLRWRSEQVLSGWWVHHDCGDVICLVGYTSGLRVLDPATGLQRWAARRWLGVDRVGARLVATAPVGAVTQPRVVLDMATGRETGTLGPWRPIGLARPDGAVPVVREEPRSRRVIFGLLDPSTMSVRVVGVAEQVAGDCGSTQQVLVCRRTDSSSGVWPFVGP